MTSDFVVMGVVDMGYVEQGPRARPPRCQDTDSEPTHDSSPTKPQMASKLLKNYSGREQEMPTSFAKGYAL